MIKIIKASFEQPLQGISGFYVQMEYTKNDLRERAEAIRRAREKAKKSGWDPDGQASIGMPTSWGLNTDRVSIWFYTKRQVKEIIWTGYGGNAKGKVFSKKA